MGYILGIDLGIGSVGFGIIDEETNEIIKYGVRLFDESDSDNNVKRRSFRSGRRLKSRRRNRISAIKFYLQNNGIININDIKPIINIYDVRIKGLTQKLTPNELANVLINIAKRRGSSLEVVIDENCTSEELEQSSALSYNSSRLFKENKYVCEIQKEYLENNGKIRNHSNVFKTTDYEKELRKILSNQDLSEKQIEDIVEIVTRRRDFSEGPGSEKFPTKYGSYRLENGKLIKVNLIDMMRGKCSIYKDELRCAKNSYTAYKFNLLNDLNNIKINEERISEKQKLEILDSIKETGSITVAKLCKYLGVKSEEVSGFRQDKNEKPLITTFDSYHKMVKDNINLNIIKDEDKFDSIIEVLTNTLVVEKRIEGLKNLNLGLTDEEINKISNYSKINGYHSLSRKAMLEIIPELISTNKNQMQIIQENGLNKLNIKTNGFNIPFNEEAILSPVVKRVHKQALRVINELRKEYGEFSSIVIETTRDKNSKEQKKRIENNQKRFEENKKRTNELIIQMDKDPDKYNTITKLKLMLYKQQEGKTIYAGIPIDLDLLLNDPTAYEIEHIIPYSISFDNSLNNKALASSSENREKGNLTPWGLYSSGRINRIDNRVFNSWSEYEAFVNELKISKNKKNNLLSQKDYGKYENTKEFIARNLVDTSYGIRTVMTSLKEHFKANNIPTNVFTIRGKITHDFRTRAGLDSSNDKNKNRDLYIHHAIDALIIAALKNQKTFKSIYKINSSEDILYLKETGEVLSDDNPLDDSNIIAFIKKLKNIEGTPFDFSYQVDKKTNRSFADQTIYSTRNYDGEDYIIKKYKDIYGEEGKSLKKLIDKGDYDKLLMYKNDKKTFDLLMEIYNCYKHCDNPFSAYKEEHNDYIRKFSKNGNGAIIKQIKYVDSKLGNHLDVSKNYNLEDSSRKVVLLQNTAYRTDIYLSPNGIYQMITVRRYHVKQRNGLNIIPDEEYNKLLSDKKMNNSKFLFSLNRNDIICLKYKNEEESTYYRFVAIYSDPDNRIELKEIIGTAEKRIVKTIGKNLIEFNKYTVSPAGKWKKVDKEDLKLEW